MPARSKTKSTRGSRSGRPIMVLLDLLGRRWTLRILWELRHERLTFRRLRDRCDDVSPTILNRRLKSLRELKLVDHGKDGYGHTKWGQQLGTRLVELGAWSECWAKEL